ncbi:MAG: hypothetical protein A3I68_01175 [Candidatus Melainabacteria bacterium RIFCSPLOWO2_02_FULL_35_15]|nr:MAG: hypothetical protein A3I68_01175 [Candidatus Melainabacteria bacterium RIFCSPLOWO2_02_FULL_35_15]
MGLYFKSLKILIIAVILSFLFNPVFSNITEQKNKPASTFTVVNYARNLLLSIVDGNFRGSWVIDPEKRDKIEQSVQAMQKSFNSLAKVKIGSSQRDVRKILNSPQDVRNEGRLWIYGIQSEDGTYKDMLEVFFDEKAEHVIGIISFNSKNITEKIGVNIGDSIDKMIIVYGEPVDEKDFIEDPDNKDYLGLYYLYPRSGIGFLLGQDKTTKNLLVQGVLVFGKT